MNLLDGDRKECRRAKEPSQPLFFAVQCAEGLIEEPATQRQILRFWVTEDRRMTLRFACRPGTAVARRSALFGIQSAYGRNQGGHPFLVTQEASRLPDVRPPRALRLLTIPLRPRSMA